MNSRFGHRTLLVAGLALALLLGLSRPSFARDGAESGVDPTVTSGIAGNLLDDNALGAQRGAGAAREKLDSEIQTAVILWDERGRPRAATSYNAATGHDNVQNVTVTFRAN